MLPTPHQGNASLTPASFSPLPSHPSLPLPAPIQQTGLSCDHASILSCWPFDLCAQARSTLSSWKTWALQWAFMLVFMLTQSVLAHFVSKHRPLYNHWYPSHTPCPCPFPIPEEKDRWKKRIKIDKERWKSPRLTCDIPAVCHLTHTPGWSLPHLCYES